MSETNEFVNKLMNKNNSELDSLLYSAEKKKGKKRKKVEADKILEEVLNETRSVSEPEKTIKLSVPVSDSSKNYHHICSLSYEIPDYISYGSICEFSEEDTAPIITDDVTEKAPEMVPEEENIQLHEEDEKVPETEDEYSALTGFDRFFAEQEKRHSKFFFILGLSITLVVILGMVSCALLGLNAMRDFADNYRTGL